jgi:hypothetical protein
MDSSRNLNNIANPAEDHGKSVANTKFARGNGEDLLLKVPLPSNNQTSNHEVSRERMVPILDGVNRKESSENERKMIWLTGEVNRLQRVLEARRQRNQDLEREAKESKESLQNAIEEAEKNRKYLTTQHRAEIERLRVKEKILTESHASSIGRLRVENDAAIAELEKTQVQVFKEMVAKGKEDLGNLENKWLQHMSNIEKDRKRQLAAEKVTYARETRKIQSQYSEDLAVQRKSHTADMKQILDQHDLEKKGLQIQIRDLGLSHEIELVKQREMSDKRAQGIEAQWTERLAEEVQRHRLSQENAQKRVNEYETQLSALQAQCTQRLHEQDELHASALKKSEDDKCEQLAASQEKYETLLGDERTRTTQAERTGALRLAQVEQNHEAEEKEWKQTLDTVIAKMEQNHESKAKEWKQTLDAVKIRCMEMLNDKDEKHKITVEKLNKRCSKLQDILLKQDSYSGLTDLEVLRGVASDDGKLPIAGFSQIMSKVTTFAEWEWREDRKIWPKDVMTSLAGTKQRRLKKLILGDAIWTTLFRLIFGSPFRILGEEGEKREKDWNRYFASGMTVEGFSLPDR